MDAKGIEPLFPGRKSCADGKKRIELRDLAVDEAQDPIGQRAGLEMHIPPPGKSKSFHGFSVKNLGIYLKLSEHAAHGNEHLIDARDGPVHLRDAV